MLSPSTVNLDPLRSLGLAEDPTRALGAACEFLVAFGVPGAAVVQLKPRGRWLARVGMVDELRRKAPRWRPEGVVPSKMRLRCFPIEGHPGIYLALRGPLLPADVLETSLEVTKALVSRRKSERRLKALQLMLDRARSREETWRDQFESDRTRARHDLKAPLSAFRGYVDLIGRGLAGPVSPTLERYLTRMRDAAIRENSLIDEHLGRRTG